jgi:ketosteroid isomerase-like protein
MKLKKPTLLLFASLTLITSCKNQDQVEVESPKIDVKVDITVETQAVNDVMKAYKDAIQNLTTEGTFELFTPNATVFEQGKVEGTYKDYIDGHLGPELDHFNSFTFSDYEIDTTVNLPYAYTAENYLYTIVLKGDEAKGTKERTIESKGVATSILKKIDRDWKIIHSHTSFKKLNN